MPVDHDTYLAAYDRLAAAMDAVTALPSPQTPPAVQFDTTVGGLTVSFRVGTLRLPYGHLAFGLNTVSGTRILSGTITRERVITPDHGATLTGTEQHHLLDATDRAEAQGCFDQADAWRHVALVARRHTALLQSLEAAARHTRAAREGTLRSAAGALPDPHQVAVAEHIIKAGHPGTATDLLTAVTAAFTDPTTAPAGVAS